MGTFDERNLRRRLAHVEALHRGATTEGEQVAAAQARERLIARIVELRAADPIARFCAEEVAELAVAPAPPPPPARLPDLAVLFDVLRRWEIGDWSQERVRSWAARRVDRVLLPEDPDAEGAPIGEVLLQLAAMHRVQLGPEHVPSIRCFLIDRDWYAWFALIAEAAYGSRRQGRRARRSA